MNSWRVVEGDALERLRELDDGCVQTCVTSPPYFGLRDYGDEGQLGLEATPDEYVARLVEVFREVRRVLRDDGTLWLNLGDSYNNTAANQNAVNARWDGGSDDQQREQEGARGRRSALPAPQLKPKDLLGIPWMVAFALRADGWYLRSEIIWAKKNCMPESVTDRPTKAHEQIFLLSKQPRYHYDSDAIREDDSGQDHARVVLDGQASLEPSNGLASAHQGIRTEEGRNGSWRNKRSVWHVATAPFPGAHFAVFPPKLIEPCVKAGSAEADTVLDPFSGAGTTGLVATRLGRSYIGIELNPTYAELSRERIRDDAPLMNYIFEQEEVTPTTYARRVPK